MKFFAIVQAIGLKKREKLPPNSIGKSVCALIQTWGYSYHPWMDNNSRYCFSMYLCKQVKWNPFQSCLFIFTHWIPIESVIKTKKQTNNKCENRPRGTFLSLQWLLELDPKKNFKKFDIKTDNCTGSTTVLNYLSPTLFLRLPPFPLSPPSFPSSLQIPNSSNALVPEVQNHIPNLNQHPKLLNVLESRQLILHQENISVTKRNSLA